MARDISVALELDNRQFNRSIKQSEQNVDKFSKNSSAGIGRVGAAFAAIGGAALIKNIVSIGQTFQGLQVSLDFVTGSAEAGAAAFDNLTTLATQTQFGVEELVQTFIRLKGAGIEPTNDLLLTFADTASLAQDQLGVLTALTELFARGATKGKLELEDFNKIAERGVDVFKPLTKEFGMSIQEIQKLAQTAQGQKQLFAGIQKALDDTYGGALVGKLKTSEVAFSNLAIASRRLSNSIFKAFGGENTDAIEGLTAAINKLADNTAALESLGKALLGVGIALASFGALRSVRLLMNGLEKSIKGVVGVIVGGGAAGGGILGAIKQFTSTNLGGLGGLSGKIVDSAGKTTGLKRIFVGLGQSVFSISGKFAALARILLRFAGPAGVAFAVFEGFNFIRKAFFDTGNEAQDLTEHLAKLNKETKKITDVDLDKMGEIGAQLFLQREAAKMAREEAARLNAEYAALTDDDTLFDMDTQEPIDMLEAFAKEIDNSLGGIDEYNRLMTLFNGLFGDPKTIADMEERQSALDDLNNSYSALFDPITALNDAISDGIEDQAEYNALQAEIKRLQEAGIMTAEAAAEAQRNLDKAFGDTEGIRNFLDTLGSAQVTLSEDLANAFLEGKDAMESFKSFFKTLITQIIADIIRLSIIQPILASILGPFGYDFGSGGNILKLAGGGRIMGNQPAIVGEEGPELFMPSTAGTVIPNGQFGIGGATSQHVTYNINAVDTQSFQQALARDPEFLFNVTQRGRRSLPSGA